MAKLNLSAKDVKSWLKTQTKSDKPLQDMTEREMQAAMAEFKISKDVLLKLINATDFDLKPTATLVQANRLKGQMPPLPPPQRSIYDSED